jgi:S1-C subfamily serine protease
MRNGSCLALAAVIAVTLLSPCTLHSQVDPSLLPATVSLRQEVIVETLRNFAVQNDQVIGGDVVKREMSIVDMGSGTLISRSGLILTNYHVWQFKTTVRLDKENRVAYRLKAATADMLVYMLDSANVFKEPKKKYVAKLVAGDEDKDVVVMRCTLDATTGQDIVTRDFPYMKLGNPFAIPLNARIGIVGYPGIGGKTVTMTEGKFLGYVGDDDCTVKTDAAISFGNSGGSAVYENSLFGVPTAVSASKGGASFGYIVPVTRAVGPLIAAAIRFGEQAPPIDRRWLASDLNSDASRDHVFVGGRLVAAQTNKVVPDARVVIFRADRTAEQIDALHGEVRKLVLISAIQKALSAGKPVSQIAKTLELDEDDVDAASKVNVERIASDEARRFFRGEFFFASVNSSEEGFFFTLTDPVPKNRAMTLVVLKEGFRRVERSLRTIDDVFQDLGAVTLYAY